MTSSASASRISSASRSGTCCEPSQREYRARPARSGVRAWATSRRCGDVARVGRVEAHGAPVDFDVPPIGRPFPLLEIGSIRVSDDRQRRPEALPLSSNSARDHRRYTIPTGAAVLVDPALEMQPLEEELHRRGDDRRRHDTVRRIERAQPLDGLPQPRDLAHPADVLPRRDAVAGLDDEPSSNATTTSSSSSARPRHAARRSCRAPS